MWFFIKIDFVYILFCNVILHRQSALFGEWKKNENRVTKDNSKPNTYTGLKSVDEYR